MLTVMPNAYLIGIGASIRIGRESLCLPYAGFFFISYWLDAFIDSWDKN